MQDKKLMQIFLSPGVTPGPGIFEVSLTPTKVFICTCPGYLSRNSCKHVVFVKDKVKKNGGNYPLEISTRCTEEDADKALESPELFREFIIKFGKIEVY